MYWAEAIAAQDEDIELKTKFADLEKSLSDNEKVIVDELNAAQGSSVDIKGYYLPEEELATQAMRPSATLNSILDSFVG